MSQVIKLTENQVNPPWLYKVDMFGESHPLRFFYKKAPFKKVESRLLVSILGSIVSQKRSIFVLDPQITLNSIFRKDKNWEVVSLATIKHYDLAVEALVKHRIINRLNRGVTNTPHMYELICPDITGMIESLDDNFYDVIKFISLF